MRFFRATKTVYDDVCRQLDAAYGYPNTETKTARSLPLSSDLMADASGRVYLAVSAEYCEYNLPAELLPQLIAGGLVEELTQQQFMAVLPPSPYW